VRNLYKRFTDLTGRSLRTVGTCISADFGECTIEYPGGTRIRAKGAGTPGTRYFVQEGKLDGEAPSLVSLEMEV